MLPITTFAVLLPIVLLTILAKCDNSPYPKFDAHLHFMDFNQQTEGFGPLIQAMDAANVRSAIVFGMPQTKIYTASDPEPPTYYLNSDSPVMYDSTTDHLTALELLIYTAEHPEAQDRFTFFACATNPHDLNSAVLLEKFIDRYPKGFVRGIGEIMSRHDDLTFYTLGEPPRADAPGMTEVYRMAARRHLPVLIHHNISSISPKEFAKNAVYLPEFERVLHDNTRTMFIWAHMGISRRIVQPHLAKDIGRLLDDYANLNVDISWVVYTDVILSSDLKSVWVPFMERYSDRVMIGSDIVGHWANYGATMNRYDELLGLLTEETRRKVSYENIEKILANPVPPRFTPPDIYGDDRRRMEELNRENSIIAGCFIAGAVVGAIIVGTTWGVLVCKKKHHNKIYDNTNKALKDKEAKTNKNNNEADIDSEEVEKLIHHDTTVVAEYKNTPADNTPRSTPHTDTAISKIA